VEIPDRKSEQALVFIVGDQLLKPAVPSLFRVRGATRGICFCALGVVARRFDGRVAYFISRSWALRNVAAPPPQPGQAIKPASKAKPQREETRDTLNGPLAVGESFVGP